MEGSPCRFRAGLVVPGEHVPVFLRKQSFQRFPHHFSYGMLKGSSFSIVAVPVTATSACRSCPSCAPTAHCPHHRGGGTGPGHR